jgi:hypothetical protein
VKELTRPKKQANKQASLSFFITNFNFKKMDEEFQESTEGNIEPLLEGKKRKIDNQKVLIVTTFLFGIFVIAEIVGALVDC